MNDIYLSKIKIVILFGGNNKEKHISLNSSRSVVELLQLSNTDISIYYIDKNLKFYLVPINYIYSNTIDDFEFSFKYHEEVEWNKFDFCIPMIHGIFGEDGSIQEILEKNNIPYLFSNSSTCKKVFQKIDANNLLNKNSIETLDHIDNLKSFITQHKKIIIKNNLCGSSINTYVTNKYQNALDYMSNNENYIAQRYINGQEFSIVVMHGVACDPLYIKSAEEFFSYTQKYYPSDVIIERFTNNTIKEMAEDIFCNINAKDCIRLDGIIDNNNNIYFLDCNIIPNMNLNSLFFQSFNEPNYDVFYRFINKSLSNNNLPTIEYSASFTSSVSIIFGGDSSEKEISLLSAISISLKLIKKHIAPVYYLLKNNYIYFVQYSQLFKNNLSNVYSNECLGTLDEFLSTQTHIFIALHGDIGEDGTIQTICEQKNIIYNGENSRTSALCINKFITRIKIETSIKVKKINYGLSKYPYAIKTNFPCVLKPNSDGCSSGVAVIKNKRALKLYTNAIIEDKTSITIDNQIIILPDQKFDILYEDYIQTDDIYIENKTICRNIITGWLEYTVGYFYHKILAASLTIATHKILSATDKFLIGTGINITGPSPILTEEEHNFICDSIRNLIIELELLSYGRIDIFYNSITKEIIIIEINTLPALTSATVLYSQFLYNNINPSDAICRIAKKLDLNREYIR